MAKGSYLLKFFREICFSSFLAFLFVLMCIILVYSGVIPDEEARIANKALGSTPFFNIIYRNCLFLKIDSFAIVPLFVSIPLVIAVVCIVYAKVRESKWQRFASKFPVTSDPIYRMQFVIIIVIILFEFSLGLPLGKLIFGYKKIYSEIGLILYSFLICVLMSASIFMSAVSDFSRGD